MAANITDVDTFTAPVAVPTDGDPLNGASVLTPFQALSNRTRNAHNRLTALETTYPHAVYSVAGFGMNGGDKYTLAELNDFGGFNLAANEVEVPATGLYLLSVHGLFGIIDLSPDEPWVLENGIYVNGVMIVPFAVTIEADGSVAQGMAAQMVYALTAGDDVSVRLAAVAAGTGAVYCDADQSRLSIVRLK